MSSKKKKRKQKQTGVLVIAVILLIVIIAAITFGTKVIDKYVPTSDSVNYEEYYGLTSEDAIFITFHNQTQDAVGIAVDGEAYLPYEFVTAQLNCRFFWDGEAELLRYALPEGLLNAKPDTTEYTIGEETKAAEYPIVKVQNGQMYLSAAFVQIFTDMRYELYSDPGRVVISDQFDTVEYSVVKKKTELRASGGIKSEVLTQLNKGVYVQVLDEMDSWSQVCTEDGFVGYMKNSALGDTQDVLYDHNYTEPYYNHISKDYEINMVWDMITIADANYGVADRLASSKGVNVIAPTWFTLSDDSGNVTSLGSMDYVATCHEQGVEVWALIANDPEVNTEAVLNHTSTREALVNNVLAEAIKCNVDGINLDFEDMPAAAGPGYLEFIRELSYKCEKNDLVLSVDNYPPADYNSYYNIKEQAVFADYVILMAYDEHYDGSEPGSVASLGFVSDAVSNTIDLGVDHAQVILGVPFYTRMWRTGPNDDGETIVTSQALTMSECDEKVAANAINGAELEWDDACGQYYTQFEYDGASYEIWVEDQNSIEKKLEVMQTYNLAGAAFWRLGYDKNMIWDTITKYIQ